MAGHRRSPGTRRLLHRPVHLLARFYRRRRPPGTIGSELRSALDGERVSALRHLAEGEREAARALRRRDETIALLLAVGVGANEGRPRPVGRCPPARCPALSRGHALSQHPRHVAPWRRTI